MGKVGKAAALMAAGIRGVTWWWRRNAIEAGIPPKLVSNLYQGI